MKILAFLMALFAVTEVAAQQSEPCYFDVYQRSHRERIAATERKIQQQLQLGAPNQTNAMHASHLPNLKIIPVVVHVIHNGGTENISNAQIQSQIDILNEDFRRKAGSHGFGNGVDAEIEFCLAKKTPDGKCTNGIVRIQSTLTNHQTFQRSMLKQLSYWDNTRYLNMYVVKDINSGSGILGYSSFPGGPPDEDGIVVRHSYFGKTGTASGGLGRTTTHEIGHWFGLYHTFQNGCGGADTCNSGDNICDTPPVTAPNFGCPNINSCTNDSYPDQVANYLDYTDDACKSIFTLGQKNRMHAVLASLRKDIWTQWNIDSTGCDSGFVSPTCKVIADFMSLNQNVCTDGGVTFYNRSQNDPTSFIWLFPGGTPSSSTATNPVVNYSTPGIYSITLIANNVSSSDTLTLTNYINVTLQPVGQGLPFYEDFENTMFPDKGITVDNPDNGITWQRDTQAKAFAGVGSAKINNLINTNYGQSDALVLPAFDFTSLGGDASLYFYWAYARSDANYSDDLTVLATSDCGVTWNTLFNKSGASLATGPTQTTPYIPDNTTVWKTTRINLGAYASKKSVIIKFVNTTDGGNNLYLDNISVGLWSLGVGEENVMGDDIRIYPNPVKEILTIERPANSEQYSLDISDMMGRIVYSQILKANKENVNMHELRQGLYFYKIMNMGKIEKTGKLFKQ